MFNSLLYYLSKDLQQTCRKIADFLGRTLSDDDVDRICRHCHVDNMRSNDQVNMAYWRNYKHINDDQPSRFINKGTRVRNKQHAHVNYNVCV